MNNMKPKRFNTTKHGIDAVKPSDFDVKPLKKNRHLKLKFSVSALFLLFLIGFFGLFIYLAREYKDTHTFAFQSPIVIRKPVIIKRVEIISPMSSKSAMLNTAYAAELTPDQKIGAMIRDKGWPYFVAIRVAKSENFYNQNKHFDCKRTNANDNGSFDYGIFQINTVHRAEVESIYGMSFEEAMTDCAKNIDYAYRKWNEQGWSPWVAYTTGRYLGHDESL